MEKRKGGYSVVAQSHPSVRVALASGEISFASSPRVPNCLVGTKLIKTNLNLKRDEIEVPLHSQETPENRSTSPNLGRSNQITRKPTTPKIPHQLDHYLGVSAIDNRSEVWGMTASPRLEEISDHVLFVAGLALLFSLALAHLASTA